MPKKKPAPKFLPPSKKKSPFFFLSLFALFCIWLVWNALNPTLPSSEDPPRLYSNQCKQDLSLVLLESLRRSTRSIYLVMFGLNDPAILRLLHEKSKQGVDVLIHYDSKGSPNLHQVLPYCRTHPIYQTGFMHHKIVILDDNTVFLGSANMTTHSLRMHDNLVIGMQHQKIASFLKEQTPQGQGHLHTLIGGQEIDLWVLPDPKGHALYELKKQIRSARRSIRAALFTFTHPVLLDELIAAHHRGIDVTLVIDMHSGLGASAKNVAGLKKAGIRVLFSGGIQLMHHKFVYIDEKILIAGSANWTKAAFAHNGDCIVMLHPLILEQKTFMNHLWKRIVSVAKAPSHS